MASCGHTGAQLPHFVHLSDITYDMFFFSYGVQQNAINYVENALFCQSHQSYLRNSSITGTVTFGFCAGRLNTMLFSE